MLRRSLLVHKVSRNWSKGAVSASTAHFPESIKVVDPASLRTNRTSAKELRSWTWAEVGIKAPRTTRAAEMCIHKISLYGKLVRFDRPVGWQLLLLPSLWGTSLAVTKALVREGADPAVLFSPFIPLHIAFMLTVGAYCMRSVGCIVNDMWDREIDRQVERTADRPLACGSVSMKEASAVLVVHLALAGLSVISLSPVAVMTALAITPVWLIYPLMKRYTHFPQLFLAVCFSWGVFVGYAAVLGRVDLDVCLPLYLASVCWVVLFDTIYAYQDRMDDLKCGVKSTAIWIGERKYILQGLVGLVATGLYTTGLMSTQSLPYYIGVTLCTMYLRNIVDDLNIHDRWSCWLGFQRNVRFGLYVLIAFCLGNAAWAFVSEHEAHKDKAYDTTSQRLREYLVLGQDAPETRAYDASSFNWLDRTVKPAYIQAEVAKLEGKTEAPPVPAWMRREYLVDNMAVIMRLAGKDEKFINEVCLRAYSSMDHYNPFATL